ncbi:MAG: hypothetical protein AB8B91_20285 [Rubripirellula sp.]
MHQPGEMVHRLEMNPYQSPESECDDEQEEYSPRQYDSEEVFGLLVAIVLIPIVVVCVATVLLRG